MGQALDARVGGGEDYGEDYVAVDLPYGGGSFSMMVVVPTGDATLAELVEEMDVARWQEVVNALRGEARTEVRLPRFELTYEKVLNDVLKAIGMEVAFDASRADFGWMLGERGARCQAPHRLGEAEELHERWMRRGRRPPPLPARLSPLQRIPSSRPTGHFCSPSVNGCMARSSLWEP